MSVSTLSAGPYSPSTDNLRNLLIIRSIALIGQAGVLAWVALSGAPGTSLWEVTLGLALLAAITMASLWRTTRAWPVADSEFFAQLLLDVLGWTVLMYFTGGANNPFVSYYVVPLVVSAAVLPWRYTWLVAGASVLAYSLLLYVYVPFPLFTPHAAMGHGDAANVHVLGMWFNFLFSAGLITYFVVRMAATLRRQEERVAEAREDRLRNDQIMAVAGLAAGTAHELGTPLSTMSLLVEELKADDALPDHLREDCDLLAGQLAQCKETLARLSRTAELNSIDETRRQSAVAFARETLAQWSVRRPGTVYEFVERSGSPDIDVDPTLGQALENLLNNAADTGSAKIALAVDWQDDAVSISVRDWGPGIDAGVIEQLGKPIIHAGRTGLGIGLMLSLAAVERAGGSVQLRNHAEGGALAEMVLPRAETAG